MPVKRRMRKIIDDYPCAWEPRPVSFERWQRHREAMLARMPAGMRPEEWWRYESPVERDPDFDVPECLQLYNIGELSEEEIAELTPRWRREFDRSFEEHFFYCLGVGKFLHGAAARKALYRWAGIPADVLKRWQAERTRRTRTIKQLAGASECP